MFQRTNRLRECRTRILFDLLTFFLSAWIVGRICRVEDETRIPMALLESILITVIIVYYKEKTVKFVFYPGSFEIPYELIRSIVVSALFVLRYPLMAKIVLGFARVWVGFLVLEAVVDEYMANTRRFEKPPAVRSKSPYWKPGRHLALVEQRLLFEAVRTSRRCGSDWLL